MSKPPRSKSANVTDAKEERDAHDFQRVAGPGPNDAGKGAAGREATARLAGAPDRVPEGRDAEEAADDDDRRPALDTRGREISKRAPGP